MDKVKLVSKSPLVFYVVDLEAAIRWDTEDLSITEDMNRA